MSGLQQQLDVEAIVRVLHDCLPKDRTHFDLHRPVFRGNEWSYMKQCLDTGWVSSAGHYVDKFEHMLREFIDVGHAVAVVNGTAALHIAMILIDIQPGDEVLIPALTFVAPANAVSYCGGIPHFVDSEERTLGVDLDKLEKWLAQAAVIRDNQCFNKKTGRLIKALVAVHTLGHPVDIDRAVEVCNRFKLTLVEDAAESLGSYYKGRHTGNWGAVSAVSFNGNKTVTTGGGGAVLTNNDGWSARAKHLTTTAKLSHPWNTFHDCIGFNYRMPNINAALGCAQLEQLSSLLQSKRSLAERYRKALSGVKGVRFFCEPPFARSNYWMNALLLENGNIEERDELLIKLNENGLESRPMWTLMHHLPMFRNCPAMDLSGAEQVEACVIQLPSGADL